MNGGRASWAFGVFFLVFAVPGVVSAAQAYGFGWQSVLLVVGFVAYAVGFTAFAAKLWEQSLRSRLISIAALLSLATVVVALMGLDSTWLYVYALSVASIAVPGLLAAVISGPVLLAIAVVEVTLRGFGSLTGDWLILLAVSITSWFMGKLIRANYELSVAQIEIGQFAVAEERARLSAELQDRLGVGLAAITEKAMVACAEVERDDVRQAAIDHVREVEELARHAVTEVRATVSGYRTASLAAEIVGAKAALEAAGITATLPAAVDQVAPAYQEAFAYALRDGVTAVLRRDSGASRCEVTIGESWLEVRDDGTTTVSEVNSQVADLIAGIGGRIDVGPASGGGSLLRVAVLS